MPAIATAATRPMTCALIAAVNIASGPGIDPSATIRTTIEAHIAATP